MNRYFAWVIRRKKRNIERWERRPWLMLCLGILGGAVRQAQLIQKDRRIRELEELLDHRGR